MRRLFFSFSVLLLAAMAAAAAATVRDADSTSEIRIPWSDKDGLQGYDRLGAMVGIYDAPADGKLTADQLRSLAAALGDGVTLEETPDGAVLVIPRNTMQKHTRRWRVQFRQWLRDSFPDAAAKAEARYGLARWCVAPDAPPDSRPVPVRLTPDTALNGRVVLLVHGLDEPGLLWSTVAPALHRAGFTPLEFMYPNDQPVRDSAIRLHDALRALRRQGATDVTIVAHSMGGLVTRECLTHPQMMAGNGLTADGCPAIRRVITCGTPNHGSQMARLRVVTEIRDQTVQIFDGNNPFIGMFLDGGAEALGDLLPGSDFLNELNARPLPTGTVFTVIAGRASPISVEDLRKRREKLNQFLPPLLRDEEPSALWAHVIDGIGDGAVTLSSTRLPGIGDHVTVDADHVNMLRDYLRRDSFVPPALPIILDRLQTPPKP